MDKHYKSRILTNVPEISLIQQVKLRPLLYDKNVKDYRKSSASENAWKEVAEILQTSVPNCRKRWKSLRDTFIKYYRLDVLNRKSPKKFPTKKWVYYNDLSFLIPHVELFRLDESNAKSHDQNDTIMQQLYENEKNYFYTEEESPENDENLTYSMKISKSEYACEEHLSECIEEDNIVDNSYVEERLDDSIRDMDDRVIKFNSNDEYMIIEQSNEDDSENRIQQRSPRKKPENPAPSSSRNVSDPDERYLLSCLPAFKRLTPKQKGLIRIGIERLFYEVEFQDDDEPKSKRSRDS